VTRRGFTGDRPKPGRNELSIHHLLVRQLGRGIGTLLGPAAVLSHADWPPLLFIFAALAMFAFGVWWFTKGQTMQEIGSRLRISAPADRPAAAVAGLTGQQ
jgi:hypothetical protein